jgi:hypothetical protein
MYKKQPVASNSVSSCSPLPLGVLSTSIALISSLVFTLAPALLYLMLAVPLDFANLPAPLTCPPTWLTN